MAGVEVWAYTIVSVVLVSLIAFVGIITLVFSERKLSKILLVLVALAAGTLLGGAFLHLLPHNAEHHGFEVGTGYMILLGLIVLFIIEYFIHWHHCHRTHMCDDPHDKSVDHSNHVIEFGWTNLIGDGLHNFLDGALIASTYFVSIPVGIATTIAVMMHEIPQEIADFGVLLHAGFSKVKALVLNFLAAVTAILGALVVLIVSESAEFIEAYLVPFTAGAFIYVAAADLMPELRKEKQGSKLVVHFVAFIAGIGLMAMLLLLE